AATDAQVVKNEVFHNFMKNWPRGRDGFKWGGWGSGIGIQATPRALVQGNVVHKNGGEGITSYLGAGGVVVRDNVVYDNWSVNIYMDNQPNGVIENNYVYSHEPDGQDLYNGDPDPSDGQSWKRLRPIGIMTADEDYGGSPAATLDNVSVANNVVVNCRKGFSHYAAAAGWGLTNVQGLVNTS